MDCPNYDILRTCKSFHARADDLRGALAALDLVAGDSPAAAELEGRADALLSEWRALGHAVVATPALHVRGLRAKLGALCALFDHADDAPGSCLAADLARSLLVDADQLAA